MDLRKVHAHQDLANPSVPKTRDDGISLKILYGCEVQKIHRAPAANEQYRIASADVGD